MLLNHLRVMTLLDDLAGHLDLLTEEDSVCEQVQCFASDALAGDTTEVGPKLVEPVHTAGLAANWFVVICHELEPEQMTILLLFNWLLLAPLQ